MPAFMTEEERRRRQAAALLQQGNAGASGIPWLMEEIYKGNPLVKKGVDLASGFGLGGYPFSYEKPTIEISRGQRPRPHGFKIKSSPFSPGLVDDLTKKAANTGPFSPELIKSLQERGPGAKQHAGMEADAFVQPEEDEMQKYLRMMFLANLAKGMKGGPPPTPYGTAVGGGNKSWATLPSMRMK
jgi:hypothetical protein